MTQRTRSIADLTPEQLERLQQRLAVLRGEAPAVDGIPRRPPGEAAPLSFAQQRLWFIDQLEPGSAAYNIPAALRLRGPLDVRALRAALREVVRRHEALRTTFAEVEGEAVQVVGPAGPVPLPLADLRGLAAVVREGEALRRVAEEARRAFDLAAGPLLRASLLRLGEAEWVLLVTMHHIVSDGWSTALFVGEVSELYAAHTARRAPALPEPAVQYADYAAWQRKWLTGGTLEGQLGYWREQLAGAPPLLELPTDRPRPAVQGDRGDLRRFRLDAEASRALAALSRREGATLFMTLMAGWMLLLARYADQEDVLVGTAAAGRTRPETERLIGFFANTLVLRVRLGGGPSFSSLLARVRETMLAAHQHQDVPFERLVEELQPERSTRHTPFFQTLLTQHVGARGELWLGPVAAEPLPPRADAAKFDLRLETVEGGERLEGTLVYRTELWDVSTVDRMLGHLGLLLAAAAADPERPVWDLDLLTAAERVQLLEEWSAPPAPFRDGACVHRLVSEQARRTPLAAAVVAGGRVLTYAQLERRSDALAHALRARGVGPEVPVGICAGRSPELLVGILAVLKAGGAYVPLDPAHPAERLHGALQDAGARTLLVRRAGCDPVPGYGGERVCLDAALPEADGSPESGAGPGNLAYVAYGSGSAGRPRGVQVEHRSVLALLRWLRGRVRPEERASVLWSAPVASDGSVAEIFDTLCGGGRLVLAGCAPEPAGEEVRLAYMAPCAAGELLRTGALPPGLRSLNLAGGALPAALARALRAAGVERVSSLYGPAEATVYAAGEEVEPGAQRVGIGRPVAHARAYVLDPGLEPVPAGVCGELYVGGAGVARGYLGRPGPTAGRFLPDPFAEPGARMFRTGDRVRWRADWTLEHLGPVEERAVACGFGGSAGPPTSPDRGQEWSA